MRTMLGSKLVLLFMAFVLLLATPAMAFAQDAGDSSGGASSAPTIKSDKEDYAPGERVTLTGNNWQPGEQVHINVDDDQTKTWEGNFDVKADENGELRYEFNLPDWFVATYQVTATGEHSGVATASFTDGNVTFRIGNKNGQKYKLDYTIHSASGNQSSNTTCGGSGTAGSIDVANNSGTNVAVDTNKSLKLGSVTQLSGANNAWPSGVTFDYWSTDQAGNTPYNGGDCVPGPTGSTTLYAQFKTGPTQTNLAAATASGTYGGSTNLSATLTAGGSGVNGKTVNFSLNGSSVGTAQTNSSGVATLSNVSLGGINAGSYAAGTNSGVGASFAGDSTHAASNGSNSLTVNKAQATLTLGNLTGHTYNGSPKAATVATSPAGLSGASISYSQNSNPVASPTNAGDYQAIASLNNPNYEASSVSGVLKIDRANPAINWSNPAAITYGTALGNNQLNAGANVPGSFSYTPASGTVLSAGTHDLKAEFTPSDTGNYKTASGTVRITVDRADLAVRANDATKTYGDALTAADLSGQITGIENGDDIQASYSSNGAAAASDIGNYEIVPQINAEPAVLANYHEPVLTSGVLKVNKAAIAIEAKDATKVYGQANPAFTGEIVSPSGVKNNDSLSVSGSSTASADSNVGDYPIVPELNGQNASNYAVTNTNGTLRITRAPLTVEARDATKVYGAQIDEQFNGVEYTGFVLDQNEDVLGGALSLSTDATASSGAGGDYDIRPTGLTSGNYAITFVDGKLTVTKAEATLTLGNLTGHIYDGTPQEAAVEIKPDGAATSQARRAVTVTYNGGSELPKNAGSYQVVASLDDDNYIAQEARGTLEIAKASLTVKASDESREYGETNPAFGAGYSGFANSEARSVLKGAPDFSTDATQASGVRAGGYAIEVSAGTLAADNYHFLFEDGTLTITRAPLTIKAHDAEKVYGEPNPDFTGEIVSLSGVKNNDSLNVSASSDATVSSDAGTYPIVPSLNGAMKDSYQVTPHNGVFKIKQAGQTIDFGALGEKTFGDAPFQVSATASSSLPVSFAAEGNCELQQDGTVAITGAGSCTITASQSGNTNYNAAQSVSRTFDIARKTAALSLNQDDLSQVYNGNLRTVEVIATPDVPDKQIEVKYYSDAQHQNAVSPVDAGTYYVVASMKEHANYTARSTEGTLVIGKAQATLSLSGLDKTYSGQAQGATVSTDPGDLRGVSISYSRNGQTVTPKDAGSYDVEAMLQNANYRAEKATGKLTIATKTLRVEADNQSIRYGDPLPDYTASFTGFVNGEGRGDLDSRLQFSTDPANPANVGNYAITPSGLSSRNYDIQFANGNLRIGRAPLTVTANDAQKYFGDPDPQFTVQYSGFAPGENASVLNGALSFQTNVGTAESAGNYRVTPSGLTSANYNIDFASGTFRILGWTNRGFFSPVDYKTRNTVKNGSTVPLKFQVFKGTEQVTTTSAVVGLKTTVVNCDTGLAADAIEETATGSTSLRYDATGGQFIYNWQTPKKVGVCYNVLVTLKDGSSIPVATFHLK